MTILRKSRFTWLRTLRGAALVLGMSVPCLAVDYSYTFNSEPSGWVNQNGAAPAGTVITTPTLNAEVSGRMFAYWKIAGQRQTDASGAALPATSFELSGPTTATAVYITTNDDTDNDGLPDWWEWRQFGNLAQAAAGDPDGDGMGNAKEYTFGNSPRLVDATADGGVASRRSSRLVYAAQTDATYVFNSEPGGLVAQSGAAAVGTIINTPALSGEVSGRTFAYWKVNGVRQAGANGAALPSAAFTLAGPTTATAVYILSSDDADADGLPDWWEWQQFGNLDQTATSDIDGDGWRTAAEFSRGYSPRMADTIMDGGVASRRSGRVSILIEAGAAYVVNSEPAGLVNQSGVAALGTVITTPALQGEVSGRTFAYWQVNGVRQAGANGVALPSVAFALAGPTTATAVYILTTEDSDGDELPDWWEWQQFGDLGNSAAGDRDGDGFNHELELRRGYSPQAADRVIDGGVASRRSARIVFVGINASPTITAQSLANQINAGGSVTLSVTATSSVSLTYEWRRDGTAVPGATDATYIIGGVMVAQAGVYTVAVTNAAGTVVSDPIIVAVVPPGTEAAHELRSAGYLAGANLTVTNTLSYPGTAAALDWQTLLPENWRFVSEAGSAGEAGPTVGTTSLLTWEWSAIPPSPITFSYTVSIPAGETAAREIVSLANIRLVGPAVRVLARPDPLVVKPAASVHAADTNSDGRIGLFELTRAIELYNTRNGTVRTGSYRVQEDTEDRFAADATRASGTTIVLSRYHTADTRGATVGSPPDGTIDLFELTRVIELYNYRAGTVRTGQYHLQSGTEDGFSPGPL
ncbi:MAG: immunoglobulin domain-containing protein [Verrucomicrobiota bacterium]